jgi:hypothetical protein
MQQHALQHWQQQQQHLCFPTGSIHTRLVLPQPFLLTHQQTIIKAVNPFKTVCCPHLIVIPQVISQITGVVDDSMAKTLAASAEAAKQFEATADSELRSKVVSAVHKLQTGLLERETEVRPAAPLSFLYCCC